MRVTRTIIFLFALVLVPVAGAQAADAGRAASPPPDNAEAPADRAPVAITAILVVASDEGQSDKDLAKYEPNLRAMLRFKAYRRVGGGTATVPVGEEGAVPLGAGQRLVIEIKNAWSGQVTAGIRWWNGDLTLANTTMTRPRKSHSVLAGPATADAKGHYAVIIMMN